MQKVLVDDCMQEGGQPNDNRSSVYKNTYVPFETYFMDHARESTSRVSTSGKSKKTDFIAGFI